MASTNLSRLDQVFTLLESGASAVTRKAAAKQLGDVQRKHPTELNNLLAKLLPYLRHTEWETRIASVEAIQALVEQVPAWQMKNDIEQMQCDSATDEDKSLLQFIKFDVDKLLSCSETLLGSSGEEMNILLDPINQAEQVKKQRKYLERSLGLHVNDNGIDMGFSSKALFKDEDLVVKEEPVVKDEKVKETCEVVMGKMFENMSSREKNLAKRKAKQMSKQRNRYRNDEKDQPARKQRKYDTGGGKTNENLPSASYFLPEDIPQHLPEPENWSEWPFKWFYENLLDLLFNSAWESRHGSCMAIRVLLKHHAATLGKKSDRDEETNDLRHEQALEDLAIRLLSVISLDRFADYVSDQVVAPVRESCAQALSVVTTFMKPDSVFSVVRILLHLRSKDEWQLRASAVVTLQYIIAVRKELMTELLSMCLNDIVASLSDGDGDVRSAAAKCLMPTTRVLLDNPTYEPFVTSLLAVLWESLLDYDELTASTHSVMLLLSNIISLLPKNKIIDKGAAHTEGLVTRLWPFLMHVDEAVRKAAVTTFFTVLNAQTDQNGKIGWSDRTCTDAIVNLFCSCLFDKSDQVQQQTFQAFLTCLRKCGKSAKVMAVNNFPYWLILTSQPSHSTFDSNYLASIFSMLSLKSEVRDDAERYIGGMAPSTCNQHSSLLHVTKTRIRLAKMIGALCWHSFPEVGGEDAGSLAEVEGTRFTVGYFEQTLLSYLQSQTSLHQTVASFALKGAWEEALHLEQIEAWMSLQLRERIDNLLIQNLYYTEITATIMELQSDVKNFMLVLNKRGFTETLSTQFGFSLDEVVSVCSGLNEEKLRSASASTTTTSSSSSVNKQQQQQGLAEQRDFIVSSAENTSKLFASLDNQCKSAGASVVVQSAVSIDKLGAAEHHQQASVWMLPSKLNSIIRPLMDTIKREENSSLVDCACDSISQLLGLCAARQPSPNNKLVKNLTVSLTSQLDAYPTLQYITSKFSQNVLSSFKLTRDKVANDGVVTILRQRSVTDVTSGRRCSYKNTRQQLDASSLNIDDVTSKNAALCLRRICDMYESKVFQVAPMMLELMNNLKAHEEDSVEASIEDDDSKNKPIIHGLALLKVILPALKDEELINQVLSLLPEVIRLLFHKRSNVRFVTSSCLATLASSHPSLVLPTVVDLVLPEFDSDDFTRRRGSVEAVANMVNEMGSAVVSYAVLLVVPLLGKMGDNLPQVRLMATSCFARLIQYIPVESSIPDPCDMPHELVQRKRHERRFLEQLFDSKSLEDYPVPITINAQLRSYQQDGVKWLAFLNRYKLHGILCDDMGLGKTLQTICIMASDHYHKEQKTKVKKKKDKKNLQNHLISLVICPPTLTGHWVEETKRFCSHLNPLHYTGVPNERVKLQDEVSHHNMVVASYEVVRNDISFFSKFRWNYCVLDEGHMIRNGKSKTSQSVKTLVANHRLILTGTPIQNNVLELWSLFDFLIPGFLGTEHEFTARFTKPIVASREAKSSSKEQEMGLLAMNALHRQVLPFMLRRMKEDVLKDLPPKIVQDYYCDLTPLQMELYEDFAKSRAKKVAENSIKEFDYEDEEVKSASNNKTSHVFQALQYLQKVCNHPAFVLTPNHPHYARISEKLKKSNNGNNNKLHDITNSCKLVALKQLLLDCGIGVGGEGASHVVSQHRALIFCLHKNMLDVIENHLFKPHMPAVTYLRLDGSVPTNQRFSTVSRFNNDPSIDVLLLSTKVGGLGLNLTGADTVIFVEHDWNPTTDIQAMDRAHRIGQKKVVNVYRIITRGTLEEKILGLQKFKLKLANTIVSEDNRALSSMGTSQVLDLFNVGQSNTGSGSSGRNKVVENTSASRGLKSMIDGLSELWDQSQYEDQYNLDNFIKSMQ